MVDNAQAGKTYYNCEVKTVVDFGVFVELLPGKDGLVHVSELAHERVENPNDVAAKGDRMDVVLLEVNARGQLKCSRKALLDKPPKPPPPPKREGAPKITPKASASE